MSGFVDRRRIVFSAAPSLIQLVNAVSPAVSDRFELVKETAAMRSSATGVRAYSSTDWRLRMPRWSEQTISSIQANTPAPWVNVIAKPHIGTVVERFAQVSHGHAGKPAAQSRTSSRVHLGPYSLASPAAMRRYKRLSNRTGAGLDPCAAIQTQSLPKDRKARLCSGRGPRCEEAQHFIQRFCGPARARQDWKRFGNTGTAGGTCRDS